MSRSIGLALIARNAEESIQTCLSSARPFVSQLIVGVDETSTDRTMELSKAAGADIVVPIQVSDWHECAVHGRVLAQHFANARNEVFKLLDPSLDFYLWMDADDVIKNPELLDVVAEDVLNSNALGGWFPYHYASIKGGSLSTTVFHRERLLRAHDPAGAAITWEWKHRVHENVVPVGQTNPAWILRDHPSIWHQEKGHSTQSSVKRNILLLEIDLEDDPNNTRAIFYLGNQYFAAGDMHTAIGYYERLGELGKNPYELWQAWNYCSLAYERIGNLTGATNAAHKALDVNPRHPEPYHRLAAIALLEGKLDLVEFWTAQSSTTVSPPPKIDPPFFVFKNALDPTFNARMPLADALAAQGRVKEARQVLEEAYKVVEEPRVAKAIEHYKKLEAGEEKANSFLRLVEGKDDESTIAIWEALDLEENVRQFGRVRQRVMPAYLRGKRGLVPRIIFWCSRAYEEWSPLSLTTTGIGGSETAVVKIAERFRSDGWNVDVYNGAGRHEGTHGGVGYWDPERIKRGEECEVFVSWRQPRAYELAVKAHSAVLWCHDLNYGGSVQAEMKGWIQQPTSAVLGVSQWHADYLKRVYGLERTDFVPNGIELGRFAHFATKERPEKNPFQCVYASSPDRGLERLLRLWPRILEQEPGTTLKIAYGWETFDKLIDMGYDQHRELKRRILALSKATPDIEKSITWCGRLGQQALADLYTESSVWAYPTSFVEVSCISAMEAMAAGTVPVTSALGALPETIGESGLLVPGLPDTEVWKDFWLSTLIGTLMSPQLRWPLMVKGMQRVQDLTWDAAYEKWKTVVNGLLAEKVS